MGTGWSIPRGMSCLEQHHEASTLTLLPFCLFRFLSLSGQDPEGEL